MAERFKLETVLKHRKHLEEKAQQVFAKSSRRWDRARQALEVLTHNRQQYQQELNRKMREDAAAGELILYHRYLNRLAREIEAQDALVEELAAQKEEHRAQLVVALKDRKIIERLKERFLESEARKTREGEQKQINEAAVNRYKTRSGPSDPTPKPN